MGFAELIRRRPIMTNKTKIALAAALIAAFATPALAQGQAYNSYHPHVYGQRMIEGRNSAIIIDSGTDTSRESLVRAN
jgi:hypothetical protein